MQQIFQFSRSTCFPFWHKSIGVLLNAKITHAQRHFINCPNQRGNGSAADRRRRFREASFASWMQIVIPTRRLGILVSGWSPGAAGSKIRIINGAKKTACRRNEITRKQRSNFTITTIGQTRRLTSIIRRVKQNIQIQ
jgi:hypothetical protein